MQLLRQIARIVAKRPRPVIDDVVDLTAAAVGDGIGGGLRDVLAGWLVIPMTSWPRAFSSRNNGIPGTLVAPATSTRIRSSP